MADVATKKGWTLEDAPKLRGRVAIVTGSTGGLGYETALGLARRGAATILAGRNAAKGQKALGQLRQQCPEGLAHFELLDLGSLTSIANFASRLTGAYGAIDILINNAGVMALPRREQTEDGFERQIGINYLGHFALTAHLKEALCQAPGGGRVVNVASLAHKRASLNLDDLQSERAYSPFQAYQQSKLAMLVFAIELQRRAAQHGWNLLGIASHPGWARTDIIDNGMGAGGKLDLKARLFKRVFNVVAQSARDAALPSIYAAAAPEAKGGGYYGPTGSGERRGSPGPSQIAPQASDPAAASRLWTLSEQLTKAKF